MIDRVDVQRSRFCIAPALSLVPDARAPPNGCGPDDLTATIVRPRWTRSPSSTRSDIDDLYLGCGLPGGECGFNMARIVAVLLGYDHLPGATITRYCSSSVQTTRMAFHAIKAGEGDVFISAGVETVSRFAKGNSDSLPDTQNPVFADAEARTDEHGRRAASDWHDPREDGAVPDAYIAMGQTAENVARLRGLTPRGARRVRRAQPEPRREGDQRRLLGQRDHPGHHARRHRGHGRRRPARRRHLEAVAELKPVFRPDGVVTAGNCCPLNDGAAAVVVMSDTKAKELGLTPLARIVSTGVTGLSPEIMGLGPVEATKQALSAREHDASTTSTWSRSTRRSPRRWCRRTRTSASTWTG